FRPFGAEGAVRLLGEVQLDVHQRVYFEVSGQRRETGHQSESLERVRAEVENVVAYFSHDVVHLVASLHQALARRGRIPLQDLGDSLDAEAHGVQRLDRSVV